MCNAYDSFFFSSIFFLSFLVPAQQESKFVLFDSMFGINVSREELMSIVNRPSHENGRLT